MNYQRWTTNQLLQEHQVLLEKLKAEKDKERPHKLTINLLVADIDEISKVLKTRRTYA